MIYLTGSSGVLGKVISSVSRECGLKFAAVTRFGGYAKSLQNALEKAGEHGSEGKVGIVFYLGIPPQPRSRNSWELHRHDVVESQRVANAYGFQFIYASSLSAHQENTSTYSKQKLAVEELVLKRSGAVVRFGLVVSEEVGSAYQGYRRLAPLLLALGLTNQNSRYYKTTISEIRSLIDDVIINFRSGTKSRLITCANPKPLSFRETFTTGSSLGRVSRTMSEIVPSAGTSWPPRFLSSIFLSVHRSTASKLLDPWVSVYFGMKII
jgi:hypothetical protein